MADRDVVGAFEELRADVFAFDDPGTGSVAAFGCAQVAADLLTRLPYRLRQALRGKIRPG